MNTILTIAKKEFRAYFLSPIAYVYLITFLVVVNWLFFKSFFIIGQTDMRVFFSLMPWIYLFFIPAVSMSKWSEEKKQGTMELLLTFPVKDVHVVLGKFVASLVLVSLALLLTLSIPITVAILGDVDVGPIIGGYLGLVFMGAAYLSVGLFVSALTENQIISFILSVVISFAMLIVGEPIFTSNLPDFLVGMFQYLGLGTHFGSIGRGVLDSRDIIYYISVVGFFIWLNLKTLESRASIRARFSRKDFVTLFAGIIIALFVVNFLASRHFFRIDLTEKHEYTLSKSTKDILKGLDDVVNIQLYFTKELPPAVLTLKRDVDDLLAEYRTYAGQNLNIRHIDPQGTPQQEYEVQAMGIPPVQINVIAKDKQEVAKLYLGMVVTHEDRKEIIPVVQGINNLEHDLTTAILMVSRKDKPQMKWLGLGEAENLYVDIKSLLKRRYEIVDVTPDKLELSPEKDALLVVIVEGNPTEVTLSEIDQYLMKGGKIIALVDMAKIGSNLQSTPLDVSGFLSWLKNNKIEVLDKFVLDHSNAYAAFSGGYITYQIPYPFWVKVVREGFDPESPMVAELDSLILPWVSPLDIGADRPDGVEYVTLARSSPNNRDVSVEESLLPENAARQMGMGAAKEKAFAILATGRLTSGFGETKAENGQLMVVGTSRFIQDTFLRQFKSNAIFFENAVDSMALGNQLVGIRSKGFTDRPITKNITETWITLSKYINLFVAPIILLIIGVFVTLIKKHKRMVLRNFYK